MEDNERTTVMAGYYYKLINRADERMRIGLTGIYWSYDKDLGDYSLGQGGYYSPQRYYSLGIPVSYAWRNGDWSVLLEGSVSWSHSRSDDSERYPLHSLIAGPLAEINAQSDPATFGTQNFIQDGSTSNDIGYRAHALLERRLTDHLVLGGGFTLQRSEDYAPHHVLLYLRYTFEPWQGNLALVPSPLIPYGDFK
ncbi:Cellulose synthase operon protein C precursor [compost metagenome]